MENNKSSVVKALEEVAEKLDELTPEEFQELWDEHEENWEKGDPVFKQWLTQAVNNSMQVETCHACGSTKTRVETDNNIGEFQRCLDCGEDWQNHSQHVSAAGLLSKQNIIRRNIIINAREITYPYDTIGYNMLVSLANLTLKEGMLYTVTYYRGILEKPEGILLPDEYVAVREGMVLNVTLTTGA